MDPLKWMNFILPDESNEGTVRQWRVKVAMLLILGLVCITLIPVWGEFRYADAQETSSEFASIKGEITAVKKSVDSLDLTIRQIEEARIRAEQDRLEIERERSIRAVRQQIYTTQRDACQSEGRLRQVLQNQVEELRSEFMSLTGEEYPNISCADFN